MFSKTLVAASAALLLLAACNKDQAAVNKLEGTWKVTSSKQWINGVQQSSTGNPETMEFDFADCNQKKETWCQVQYAISGVGMQYAYQIDEDGTRFILDADRDPNTTNDRTTNTIEELTKSKFVWSYTETDTPDVGIPTTYKYEITAEKQ